MAESAGEALSRTIRGGLPTGVELDEREEALLAAAARQADAVEALEADIAERGYVIGSRLNSSVPEARQGRTALARLLGGLDLPTRAALRRSAPAGRRIRVGIGRRRDEADLAGAREQLRPGVGLVDRPGEGRRALRRGL